MKYREFIKQINWGDTTAFVHDSPKERYQYESGEINDAVFAKTTSGTDFDIVGIASHGGDSEYDLFKPTIGGKQTYKRILIKRKGKQS